MFYKLIREKVTESVTFQITVTSIEFDHYERGKGNIDEHSYISYGILGKK